MPLGFGLVAFETISPRLRRDESELVVWAPWLTSTAGGASAVSWIGLAILAAATQGRRGPSRWALVSVALLLLGGALVALIRQNFGWRPISDWAGTPSSEHVTSDGTKYRGFGRRWLEGGVTIGRHERVGWCSSAYRVLASGDLVSGPFVVLPARSDRSSPIVANNGCVAIVLSPGICAAAATLEGRPLVGSAPGDPERPDRRASGRAMSVFRLVGASDGLDEESVRRFETEIAAVADGNGVHEHTVPVDEDLAEALDSPNEDVRNAAARFVRAGTRRLYPKASDKLGR